MAAAAAAGVVVGDDNSDAVAIARDYRNPCHANTQRHRMHDAAAGAAATHIPTIGGDNRKNGLVESHVAFRSCLSGDCYLGQMDRKHGRHYTYFRCLHYFCNRKVSWAMHQGVVLGPWIGPSDLSAVLWQSGLPPRCCRMSAGSFPLLEDIREGSDSLRYRSHIGTILQSGLASALNHGRMDQNLKELVAKEAGVVGTDVGAEAIFQDSYC